MRKADEGVDVDVVVVVDVGVVAAVTKSSWFRLGARCQVLGLSARVGDPGAAVAAMTKRWAPYGLRETVIPTYNVCSTPPLRPG